MIQGHDVKVLEISIYSSMFKQCKYGVSTFGLY